MARTCFAELGIFADPLGDDVAGAFERLRAVCAFDRRQSASGVRRLVPQELGERL